MIRLLRVDDRLIHGQVAVYWVSATAADTIVVASDKYAANSMLKMSLTVGKPAGVKMEILSIAKACDYLNNAANAKRKILLICGSCQDALSLVQKVAEIEEVDLGGIRHGEGSVSISNQVHLSKTDIEALNEISEMGKTVYVQEAPNKNKVYMKEINEIFNKG